MQGHSHSQNQERHIRKDGNYRYQICCQKHFLNKYILPPCLPFSKRHDGEKKSHAPHPRPKYGHYSPLSAGKHTPTIPLTPSPAHWFPEPFSVAVGKDE